MTVFDFDKTLTNQDTLFGFYREANQKNMLFGLKRLVLIGFAVLYKIKVISNDQLKQLGVSLFLNGKTKEEITQAATTYARKIELNAIYRQNFLNTPQENRMIISASLEEYLSIVFPHEKVIASTLQYKAGKVSGLKQNMYHQQKAISLQSLNILQLDKIYTDSFSDQPLMEMANQVLLIKDGMVAKEWKPNNKQ